MAARKSKTPSKSSRNAAAKPEAKPAETAPKPATTVVEETKPVLAAGLVKQKELVDRVVAETGMKKKDVKPVVEATMAVLARTLTGGEELQVQPLGKVKIQKVKEVANAKIMTLKLRHSTKPAGVQTAVKAAE